MVAAARIWAEMESNKTWRCFLNKAANTYWIDNRLAAQRPSARSLTLSPVAQEAVVPELVVVAAPRAAARRHSLSIPSWVVFCMIMLATFALCVTVTMRTHAEMRDAEQNYERMSADVEQLRDANASLHKEVERLRSENPRAIEAAARARLNMVRANEVVIPLE